MKHNNQLLPPQGGSSWLFQVIKRNKSIQELILSYNRFDTLRAQNLLFQSIITHPTLQSLVLDYTKLKGGGATELSEGLQKNFNTNAFKHSGQ